MKNNKLLACPYIVWMILFTIIPLGIVFYYALTDSITGQFTLANLAGMGTYLPIFLRSIWLSLFASLICLVIGYPVAYFIAQCKPLTQRFLEMLIMLPMCMSFLLRTLAWVVAVMLPPMAIFFPLFTLLEDAGYLPRVAYNLDRPFQACRACGKQALTMCMGLGCNAAGVVGCRIIDSERERLLAVLTNSLMPCNGRFPALIALMTMFFSLSGSTLAAALLLTAALTLCVGLTFGATWLLSVTVLRGKPSAFVLELPPYRAPQVGQVLVRSVFDRTLFVLGRAAAVAAPAGMALWALANVHPGGVSLLTRCAAALDPLGRVMGMDGVLLLAFVLGFPANEIVLPIAVMGYLAQGSLGDVPGLAQMHALLTANGWTWTTAVSAVLFFLLHWPCSTTLWTIRRETGSAKWTLLAALLPTALGMALCTAFTALARLLGW